ncbi:Biopolymer transport protein ExbD/TolR [Planctomycetes bacterium Pan216]|uniref:Biopolymer transport protein ExbD/TolR n=1 Tax=Kolteria novifilia TaxID=2527975 RepID=A0A518AYJ7_9BACT|nr:Biopolymer transport protein ExbD/TolR [Planctomycetes bacterium Pan216]
MRSSVSRHAPAEKVDATPTPMLDIIFNVLFFFLVTIPDSNPETSIDIELALPAPGTVRVLPPDEDLIEVVHPIMVRLDAGVRGELLGIQVDGRKVPENRRLSQLEQRLRLIGRALSVDGDDLSLDVVIAASSKLKYGDLMRVISICRRVGATSLAFAEMPAAIH